MKEIPVAFKSGGEQLVGVLHTSTGKKSPCVIMCHGYGGDKLGNRMFVKAARYFSRHGIAAFRFDFMGCGDSEGDFKEITVTKQIRNLEDAVSFLESIVEIEKNNIGVIGWSRGSAVCILTASKDKRIKCIVSWAGESDFRDQWPNSYIKEAQKRGEFSFWGTVMTRKSIEDEKRHSIAHAVKRMKKPLLVVHGTKDVNVPFNQGETLYKNANKPKRLFAINGADHSFMGFEDRVISETFKWFNRWL